jgi:DNA-binding NtrC family response regulator
MNERGGTVLVVDDEPNAVKVLSSILTGEGYSVLASEDVDGAIRLMFREDIDAVITDIRMPGKDGLQFFEYMAENHADIPVIFLTAFGTVESAVHTIQRGAFNYFIKPPDYPKLKSTLAKAVEQRQMKRELGLLRRNPPGKNNGYPSTGNTPQMLRIFEPIETIKDSESSVLICGETGTGKELIARSLHYSSKRSEKPFVAFNCSAIPRELVESELFGYEKGAFTGANSRRIGRFEEVSGGTIFLDEIGELELPIQAKLLRVLQEREIARLGSNMKINVDFRLVSSTNRDLNAEVREGRFREDLYYRINVVQVRIPPLRERRDDIPLLASEFLKEFCLRENKTLTISGQVTEILRGYDWPGNVRQLRNVIERAVALSKNHSLDLRDLPEELNQVSKTLQTSDSRKTLKEVEFLAIRDALEKCNGNKSKAAKILGISRKALYKRLSDEGKCFQSGQIDPQ